MNSGVKKFADLHVHTFYSDGDWAPDEVVKTAHKKGLSAIAITDHDSVGGIAPSIESARKYGIEIIPGVELTAEEEDLEIHILGYFINWKEEWFEKRLEKIRKTRLERIYAMVDNLKKIGVNINIEKVFKVTGPGAVGRLHLATALYNEGITTSINEAFRRYIGDKSPCYVKKYKITNKEAVDMITKLGGVPVLAHPHTLCRDDLITRFVKEGIRGIEVYHTEHAPSAMTHYEEIALNYGLLITGGSDCHGAGKGEPFLGAGIGYFPGSPKEIPTKKVIPGPVRAGNFLGRVKIPYYLVESLKKEADNIKMQNNDVEPRR